MKFHKKLLLLTKEQELVKLERPLGGLPAKIQELPAALESMSWIQAGTSSGVCSLGFSTLSDGLHAENMALRKNRRRSRPKMTDRLPSESHCLVSERKSRASLIRVTPWANSFASCGIGTTDKGVEIVVVEFCFLLV